MYEGFIARSIEMLKLKESDQCRACSLWNSNGFAKRKPFVRQKGIRRKNNRKSKLSSDLEKCALVTIDLVQKEMQRKSNKSSNSPAVRTHLFSLSMTKKIDKIRAWFKKWKYRKILRNSKSICFNPLRKKIEEAQRGNIKNGVINMKNKDFQ